MSSSKTEYLFSRQMLDGVHAILGGVARQAGARERKRDQIANAVVVLDDQYVF